MPTPVLSTVALLSVTDIEAIVDRAVARALAERRDPPPEILDTKSAGKLLCRSAKFMERVARQGCPAAFRLGVRGSWRFRRGPLIEWAGEAAILPDGGR